jgi:precorrin-3B C17-methyltransferase
MTSQCRDSIEHVNTVVGYKTYIDLLEPFLGGKEVVATGMGDEVTRCRFAIEAARSGKKVGLISSGDPGVYGMAGLALEMLTKAGLMREVDVAVVPGIPVIHAAAARLGAPLANDYAVISLSDLLTPWNVIKKRLEAALAGDFVICLYNPRSSTRTTPIEEAHSLFLAHRQPDTPVGLVRNVTRNDELVVLTDLRKMLTHPIDMRTTVVVGNSHTRVADGYMITPRGYDMTT